MQESYRSKIDHEINSELNNNIHLLEQRKRLDTERKSYQNKKERYQIFALICSVMSLGLINISLFLWWLAAGKITISVLATFMASMFVGLCWSFCGACSRRSEEIFQNFSFEYDLLDLKAEVLAERMFRFNRDQIRRYHETNLSHNKWIFGLGVFCIIIGALLIVTTIYAMLEIQRRNITNLNIPIIVSFIGAIGSFMTNYIAYIFLKMYSSFTENLRILHESLAETHRLLLGNLLISRIENKEKQWQTLSYMAINLSKQQKGTS